MINKNGDICYRSEYSKCQSCEWYLGNSINKYKCWSHDYIPYMTWEHFNDPKEFNCPHFKCAIPNQNNNHFIFQDYEDEELFPDKKFGGTFKFDSKGKIVGKL